MNRPDERRDVGSIDRPGWRMISMVADWRSAKPWRMPAPMLLVLLVLPVLAWNSPAWGYSSGQWLYEVEMPVSAQSQQERQRVASAGILQVLSRVTGLSSIPRNAEITAALANPGQYYNEFVFFTERDEQRREQPHLRIIFQREAMLDLSRRARLPIWWNRRPEVMTWVVVEQQGRRQILDSNSQGELADALRSHALRRGLPIILPLMDLDDSLSVSAGDIWGRVAATLERGAQRYGADLVMVGRIRAQTSADGSMAYQGDWEVWRDGQPLVVNTRQADAAAVTAIGIDALADQLSEQFTVLPRGLRRQQFAITGLQGVAGYAALMDYVASLEFVERVHVASLQPHSLNLQLDSHAGDEQMIMLLTAEGRLQIDDQYRGTGIGLLWQD